MKINYIYCKFLLIFLLFHQISTLQLGSLHQQDLKHTFCWRDSYGRGAGTIPTDCGRRVKLGLLCYEPCPSGYTRVALDCHSTCPSGFKNQGLFCRQAEYGRGAGYPWKFRDGFSSRGMWRRCQSDHGRDNCEKNGAIVYPKCRKGYSSFGCCICRPYRPNCKALGLNNGLDLSCAKKIRIGEVGTANCPGEKQNDAGLCYKKCKRGYRGVGPVCWAETPSGWTGCGMGAARSASYCGLTIFHQVATVGNLALNIATLGGSGAANSGLNAGKNAAKLTKLRKMFAALKTAYRASAKISKIVMISLQLKQVGSKSKDLSEQIATAKGAQQIRSIDTGKVTEADLVRISAQIASLADPTGIASTIAAFSYPKCSQILYDPKKEQNNQQDPSPGPSSGRRSVPNPRKRVVIPPWKKLPQNNGPVKTKPTVSKPKIDSPIIAVPNVLKKPIKFEIPWLSKKRSIFGNPFMRSNKVMSISPPVSNKLASIPPPVSNKPISIPVALKQSPKSNASDKSNAPDKSGNDDDDDEGDNENEDNGATTNDSS